MERNLGDDTNLNAALQQVSRPYQGDSAKWESVEPDHIREFRHGGRLFGRGAHTPYSPKIDCGAEGT